MPKKLGRARNPPLHYLSDGFPTAAGSQVTSRHIRDCDLAILFSFVVTHHQQKPTHIPWSIMDCHPHYSEKSRILSVKNQAIVINLSMSCWLTEWPLGMFMSDRLHGYDWSPGYVFDVCDVKFFFSTKHI